MWTWSDELAATPKPIAIAHEAQMMVSSGRGVARQRLGSTDDSPNTWRRLRERRCRIQMKSRTVVAIPATSLIRPIERIESSVLVTEDADGGVDVSRSCW